MADQIVLPGLIDIHVHLRDPGQTDKEDFVSGTSAALAGGFTAVYDMPNNTEPIFTVERLKAKIEIARIKTVCDIGFYFGSQGDNLDKFAEASELAKGLKLYLNHTTGNFLMDPKFLKKIYTTWPASSPILLHAEEDVIDVVIESLIGLDRPIHICHMPSKYILEKIIAAKNSGLPVTCGVTPHHLFLNDHDAVRLGVYGQMKPSLKPIADVEYLWEHLNDIDMIESDHAPHTIAEKEGGAFGVPGLETTLPLLITAMQDGKLTKEDIIRLCSTAPAKLVGYKIPEDTSVTVELGEFEQKNSDLVTKCGWSPFNARVMKGRVAEVRLRGQKVYADGKILVEQGSGNIII